MDDWRQSEPRGKDGALAVEGAIGRPGREYASRRSGVSGYGGEVYATTAQLTVPGIRSGFFDKHDLVGYIIAMQISVIGFLRICLVLLVLGIGCFAQSAQSEKQIPKTVDEAVTLLKSELTPSLREYFLRTPRDQAGAELHMSFGMGIRNRFRLWRGNPELMKSCGVSHPDNCSGVIIEKLWETVRSEADPQLVRQLDCQFRLADAIHIDYRTFDQTTTGQLLQSLETQVNEQLSKLKSSGSPLCQDSLSLQVVGDPKLDCFVRAEFAHADKTPEVTLERLFGWIGWRNDFATAHEPPAIILKFRNKCAWPKPPRF